MVTKHNIRQLIEDYLNENKIRFNVIDPDSKGCLYELYVSSVKGYLQVEYDLDQDTDEYVVVQLFTDVDSNGDSLYHSEWDNESEGNDSIEGEIDNLIDSVKNINKALSKIHTKVEQIIEICEEHQLDWENFIQVLYNFD